MHGARPSYSVVATAVSDGHQCQPSLVHRVRESRAALAERQRRHGRLLRRISRISGEARNAGHAVVFREERFEGRVVDRPVIGHAVERSYPEIRRMQPGIVPGIHDGAAADAVEIHHLDRRVVVVDRIVRRPRPAVRAGGEIVVQPRLPVAPVARVVRLFHPIALFQAEDFHPSVGQAPRHRGARSAGADDQYVHRFVHPAAP